MREWLSEIRKLRQMTQTQVARMSGIAQPSYYAIEAGQSTPKPDTAKRIAGVLGFDWTRFYEEEDGHDIPGKPE